jgi:hypothetical protein
MNPLSKDNISELAVIDFISKRRDQINADSKIESGAPPKPPTKEEEMMAKITAAKMHANKEIKEYRRLIDELKVKINELALFRNVGDSIEAIAVNYILESIIEPILKGNKPYGMEEDFFRKMRANMFKTLINRYIDNIGEGTDNPNPGGNSDDWLR